MAITTSPLTISAIAAVPIRAVSRVHRRLVINADDLGLSRGVNRGIIKSAECGVVTSVSMIANMPDWDDALARLHATRADISVGLHFNIVAGRPLTSAPSITDPTTGAFYSLPQLAMRAISGRVSRDDVSAECVAQLAKLRAAGIRVSHIDSHRHVHALPGIGGAVLETAQMLGISMVRTPLEPLNVNPGHWQATLKKMMLGASWHAWHGWHAPSLDHFFGISLQGGSHFTECLNNVVDQLPAGTSEIMVHPGFTDAALASVDGYTWQRECEIEALTSPTLRNRLDQRGIELVNFGSLIA